MIELVTERLALRPFRVEDRPLLAGLMRDPAVFFWETQPVSDAAVDAVLERTRALEPRAMGWFAAFSRDDDGTFVGTVALKPADAARPADA